METQIAREITGKTHYQPDHYQPNDYQPDHYQPNDCQPDHTTVNGYFSCPMGLAGPADESSPVFDKVTCSGCLVALIGQTLKLIVPS